LTLCYERLNAKGAKVFAEERKVVKLVALKFNNPSGGFSRRSFAKYLAPFAFKLSDATSNEAQRAQRFSPRNAKVAKVVA